MTGLQTRLGLSAISLLVVASCSLTLDTVDERRRPREREPECDVGATRPMLDALMFVLSGVVTITAVRRLCENTDSSGAETHPCDPDRKYVYTFLAPTVIYGLASTYGFYQISRCRDAISTRQHRQPDRAAPP